MKMRLQKYLASLGLGSRRAIDNWIKDKKIKVNGKIAELGDKVDNADRRKRNGRLVKPIKQDNIILLFNKPKGVMVTRSDPAGRKTIYSYLPKKYRYLKYAGRLDYDSTGLLLLTNNGDLIQELTHPSKQVKKVYQVKIHRNLKKQENTALQGGVKLQDGPGKFLSLKNIREKTYQIEVAEGRNRFIRRMLGHFNVEVLELKRTKFGKYGLGGLKSGEFTLLHKEQWLKPAQR
jgi:23S rRNA pseudouridine2605 synthase